MIDWQNRYRDDPWLTPEENAANRRAYAPDVTAVATCAADPTLDPTTLCTINAATQPPRTGHVARAGNTSGVATAQSASADAVWETPPYFVITDGKRSTVITKDAELYRLITEPR